jgi:N-carbamoyl-L-amino-acid hydrolase
MAMLFVRNENGSHNPDEAMDIDDLLQAVAILTLWLIAETCDSRIHRG